jgi:glycosyltransferase involved in cell wall biosynthesis
VTLNNMTTLEQNTVPLVPSTKHGDWLSMRYEPSLVSVIIPVYNRENKIVRALDSVWAQTYRPLELIVVDDGSTDGTNAALRQWGQEHLNDRRFEYEVCRQSNSGAPAARNLGAIRSRGEYIQFVDSDDVLVQQRFEKLVAAFRETGADTIHSGFERRCGDCNLLIDRYIPRKTHDPLSSCLLGRMWVNTFDFIDHRTLVARVGPWDEALMCTQDRDYSYRRLIHSRKVGFVCESLYEYEVCNRDRISVRRQTQAGWESRLRTETRLCLWIMQDGLITEKVKTAYATQLYFLGIKLYAFGFNGLGKAYGDLSESLKCKETDLDLKRMRFVWKRGAAFCRLWVSAREMKRSIKRMCGREKRPHRCQ